LILAETNRLGRCKSARRKIVMGGGCSITTGNDAYDFTIARLNADGSKGS
jgi:hypothetical protein